MKKCFICEKILVLDELEVCTSCSTFLSEKYKGEYSARLKELKRFFQSRRKKLNSGGKK